VRLDRDHRPVRPTGSVGDRRADHLVDPHLAVGRVVDRQREHAHARERGGRVAFVDARQGHDVAALVRTRGPDGDPAVADPPRRADRERRLDVGGQGDHDVAADAVRTTDPRDLEPLGRSFHVDRRSAYSATSTPTRTPSIDPAARATWRTAWMTRPRRPMMRPRSPGLAWINRATASPRSLASTNTPSGSSTR